MRLKTVGTPSLRRNAATRHRWMMLGGKAKTNPYPFKALSSHRWFEIDPNAKLLKYIG